MSAVRKAKKQIDPYRRSLYAKIEMAKKELGLDDDAYRSMIGVHFPGKSSRKQLGNRQLVALIEHMKDLGFKPKKSGPKRAGSRPIAGGKQQSKIRALWLDLYHLGEITDPSEAALSAYSARMTKDKHSPQGVQALQWLHEDTADKVIRGLRGWLERIGHRFPEARDASALLEMRLAVGIPVSGAWSAEKVYLINTQWNRLVEMDAADRDGFGDWLQDNHGARAAWFLSSAQADRVIEDLGRRIRKAKG